MRYALVAAWESLPLLSGFKAPFLIFGSMSNAALKLEALKYVMSADNDGQLKAVLSIFNSDKSDFWNELTDAQKAEVELSRQQISEGKVEEWEAVYKRLSR